MRSKKEPSLCVKTQGRIANQVCRPRQDLWLVPPAVFGTHLVLYLILAKMSRIKYQFIPFPGLAGLGKRARKKPAVFPVLPPQAEEDNQIIFAATCAWRKFIDPRAVGAHASDRRHWETAETPPVAEKVRLFRGSGAIGGPNRAGNRNAATVEPSGVARRGACPPPKDVRSSSPCSSSRRGPWWTQPRSCGYTGPWRRQASPSRWRPSARCSSRSASRGRRTPCRWGSG